MLNTIPSSNNSLAFIPPRSSSLPTLRGRKKEKKMRMSCNGCRVLRKGCSDDCSIRPCLQWIKNPEAQANATVFLAKFYGRAGLINLVNAGPHHLRPAIFRSLLYEACGRVVNPIYGAVGLLWSGRWDACQAAVQAVMRGEAVVPVACDIRHVAGREQAKSRGASRSRRRSTTAAKEEEEEEEEEEVGLGLELTLGFEAYNCLKPGIGDQLDDGE